MGLGFRVLGNRDRVDMGVRRQSRSPPMPPFPFMNLVGSAGSSQAKPQPPQPPLFWVGVEVRRQSRSPPSRLFFFDWVNAEDRRQSRSPPALPFLLFAIQYCRSELCRSKLGGKRVKLEQVNLPDQWKTSSYLSE